MRHGTLGLSVRPRLSVCHVLYCSVHLVVSTWHVERWWHDTVARGSLQWPRGNFRQHAARIMRQLTQSFWGLPLFMVVSSSLTSPLSFPKQIPGVRGVRLFPVCFLFAFVQLCSSGGAWLWDVLTVRRIPCQEMSQLACNASVFGMAMFAKLHTATLMWTW